MKKTGWTNFLAFFLALTALSGVANSVMMLRDQQWQATVLAILVVAYALSAIVASFSLFTAKVWAPKAFGAWAVTLLVTIIPMQFWVTGAPLYHVVIFAVLVSFFMFKIYKYIRRCANAP
ncbi:hypothetical protein GCM10023116_26170 [Kistimonas scapharcae]|uniref:Uncharacterized protein n=1 Tax=Kistimonas scapharcae TaxID=1036133 RepID=A0ABP8V2U8_9GAMM